MTRHSRRVLGSLVALSLVLACATTPTPDRQATAQASYNAAAAVALEWLLSPQAAQQPEKVARIKEADQRAWDALQAVKNAPPGEEDALLVVLDAAIVTLRQVVAKEGS